MFLSRETDIKLCQNYTNTVKYKILYKTDHIQQIRNQSENYHIPQKTENLRFLIDKIANIITYIIRITSPELPPMAVQYP